MFNNLFIDTHSIFHVKVRIDVKCISPPKFFTRLMIQRRELNYRMIVIPFHGYLYESNNEQVWRCKTKISVRHHTKKLHDFTKKTLGYLFFLNSLLGYRTEVEKRDETTAGNNELTITQAKYFFLFLIVHRLMRTL